jgi:hypothetical protein
LSPPGAPNPFAGKNSVALAINTNSTNRRAAGASEPCGAPGAETGCLDRRATRWLGGTALLNLGTTIEGAIHNESRDVNESNQYVGATDAETDDQQPGCEGPVTATYWSGDNADPFDLGELFSETQGTRAMAMNNVALRQVVGYWGGQPPEAGENDPEGERLIGNAGLMWEQCTGGEGCIDGWKVTVLDQAIKPDSQWLIFEAHDINDNTWIIVLARNPNIEPQRPTATLLTPFNAEPFGVCPYDIDDSGAVGVDDMLAVIMGWGPCTPGLFCLPDVDGDFIVNVDDLLEVITHWNTACDGASDDTLPETIQDCVEMCEQQFPDHGSEYADCLAKCIASVCARNPSLCD